MLEKPDLPDERLCARLQDDFGLRDVALRFLPWGADFDTAVYRADAADGDAYFVKLRRGAFEPTTVLIPRLLCTRGVPAIVAPRATVSGALWTRLDSYTVMLAPFIAGRDGYARTLTDAQWVRLGEALRGLHELEISTELRERIPRETFTPRFRERVHTLLALAESEEPADEVVARLAELLRAQYAVVVALLERAERHAAVLRGHELEHVVCHADLHAGNVLVGDDGSLHLVDWDTLILAPRERDLMSIGMGGVWHGGRQAELFYRGYGPVEVLPIAIAYYRCERIIQDIEAYCTELLLSVAEGADRAQSLRYLSSNFEPGGLIDVAMAS